MLPLPWTNGWDRVGICGWRPEVGQALLGCRCLPAFCQKKTWPAAFKVEMNHDESWWIPAFAEFCWLPESRSGLGELREQWTFWRVVNDRYDRRLLHKFSLNGVRPTRPAALFSASGVHARKALRRQSSQMMRRWPAAYWTVTCHQYTALSTASECIWCIFFFWKQQDLYNRPLSLAATYSKDVKRCQHRHTCMLKSNAAQLSCFVWRDGEF